jgi:uncharacterized protein (DUF2062 family)
MVAARIGSRGWGERLGRLLRLRLLIPILRGRHSPEYTARGVFWGLLVAMTPLVGVQMGIILAIWLVARRLGPRHDFNIVVAMAWTWITNVFTLPPIYYGFLVTGRLLLGHWEAFPDFAAFTAQLDAVLTTDASWLDSLWLIVWRIAETWGLPMLLGCVPWAIISGVLGYRWSLQAMRRFRIRRGSIA